MRKSLIATLFAATLAGGGAHAATLLQVYQEALANDAVIASARANLLAGREREPQAFSQLLPQLGVNLSSTRTLADLSVPGVTTDRNNTTNAYLVSLTQPIFRLANWEAWQQGKLQVASTEAIYAQAQQDLIVRVSQAYFDVLASQDALATVQAQMTAITEQLASAKRNFEVGTATITDSQEAQARYDLAQAQEIAAQADLQIRRAAVQQIIGRPPESLAPFKPGLKLETPQPSGMEDWVKSAESQNFSVVGQQLAVEIAAREIKRNRAGHAPTVDVVASRGRNLINGPTLTIPSATTTTNSTQLGVQLNVPLYSGGLINSRVREAVALQDKARSDLENARRTAAQGARQAFLSVSSGLAQVRALEAAEVSSQSALDSNLLGYQVGVRINIDVLNAQQQLYTTRRDLARARYDTVINGFRLKNAAGVLNEEDLARINMLLQP
jgi:outer membrane protein